MLLTTDESWTFFNFCLSASCGFACISNFRGGKCWPAEPELEGCRWAKDVGREAGAGKPLLKTIFQVRSNSESTGQGMCLQEVHRRSVACFRLHVCA